MNILKKNTIPVIVQIAIVVYALRLALPVWGFYMPAMVNAALLAFLYVAIFVGRVRLRAIDFLAVIPIFSVEILSLFYETPSDIAIYIYKIAQLFIFPLLGLYLIKSDNHPIVRRIFYIVSIAYLVTCVTTYLGCLAYPVASRELATFSQEDEMYSLYTSINIGGFSFVYAIVLMLPLLIYLVRDKRLNIIIGVIALLMVVITIFVTEYATALLFMIVAFMSFIFPKNFSTKHIIITMLTILVIYWGAKEYLGHAFDVLATNVDSEILAERFYSISDLLLGDEKSVEGDIESRVEVYELSVKAFEASPIWGASGINVGGHSFFLDNLGKYGCFGLIAMIFMYSSLYKLYFKRYKSQPYSGYILLTFFIALALAILNPKENLAILTFIVPLFTVAFKK